jgi:squalene synthase HpnC
MRSAWVHLAVPVNADGLRRCGQSRTVSVEHYENFPVASWLCRPALRPTVQAIYWFARTADDIADEGDAPASERLASLTQYRAELAAAAQALQGTPIGGRWPGVFGPLAAAIRTHALPLPLLQDLLSAFEQDVHNPRYADRAQLLDYCSRSANPIGRLLLHLYGVNDSQALAESDAVCSALQLINFWQDLSVDVPRNRHYVPLADAARHGIRLEQLQQSHAGIGRGGINGISGISGISGIGGVGGVAGVDGVADIDTRPLVRDLCQWAADLMHQGAPLVHRLPGRAGWELRLVVQGGLRILETIEHMDHATLHRRPALSRIDAPRLLWRALTMRAGAPTKDRA